MIAVHELVDKNGRPVITTKVMTVRNYVKDLEERLNSSPVGWLAHELGSIYQHGCGDVPIDRERAIYYHIMAANIYTLATQNLYPLDSLQKELNDLAQRLPKQSERMERSRKKKIAEFGDAKAQYDMALEYYLGDTPHKALAWFVISACNGYVHAQYMLGQLYRFRDDIATQDLKIAEFWLIKVAEQGLPVAMYDLGVLYSYKKDSDFYDLQKAKYWLNKALELGKTDALNILDRIDRADSLDRLNSKDATE